MKQFVLFVAMFMAAVSICSAESYQLSGVSGGYKVVVKFAQIRPTEGKNAIEVAVIDANSRPVKGSYCHT